MDLLEFFYTVLQYIEYAFNIRAPFDFPPIKKDIAEYITDKLFTDGIFGQFDGDNLKNYLVNKINYTGKLYLIKRFINAVFLPLRQMRNLKEYRYLQEYPMLLPWAWVVRVARKIKNKESIKEKCFEIDDYLQKRNTLFSIWGIKNRNSDNDNL